MRPFKIDISDEQHEDLAQRLRFARLPSTIFRPDAQDGVSLPFMRKLLQYWRTKYDWRANETRLNRLPQFITSIEGSRIHYVHKKGMGPAPVPLILTHGWPGSFMEFEAVIELLTDPAKYGGDPRDAFDIVVPSLPGFGFSSAPVQPGTNSRKIAHLWRDLMHELGYQRFCAQGGDIGAGVSTWLGALFPDNVIAVHLNYMSASFKPPLGPALPPVSAEEEAFIERAKDFAGEEGAYSALQATKPQTLAFALSDSPLGLAAWMAEKFVGWSDHGGELEEVISLDQLLTNVCIYWFGNTIESSLRLYKENRLQPLAFDEIPAVNVPFAIAHFPKELPIPPRSWMARALNVTRWTEMPRGGHFAALEQPVLLAEDIKAAFRRFRGS